MRARHQSDGRFDQTLGVLFVVAIWLPLLGGVLGIGSMADSEKRVLAPLPSFVPDEEELAMAETALDAYVITVRALPRRFEAFYDDHFGFRTSLIRAHGLVKYHLLRTSPSSKVVLGKDGWLFFDSQRNLETYVAADPFTEEELAAWTTRFAEIQEWLDDRGIRYLLLFAPAKPTIYPEHLPGNVRKVGETTRLDQVLAHLEEHTEVLALDPRADFLAAKADGKVYYELDSHWTMLGAFVAYRVLAEALREWYPAIDPYELHELGREPRVKYGGDLAGLTSLGQDLSEDDEFVYFPVEEPFTWTTEHLLPAVLPDREVSELRRTPGATEQDADDLPDVVMFHDSFGTPVVPMLAHELRRGVFYRQLAFDPKIVDRERPDVVIQEIGERILAMGSVGKPVRALRRDFLLRRAFRARSESLVVLPATDLAPATERLVVSLPEVDGGVLFARVDLDLAHGTRLRVVRAASSEVDEEDDALHVRALSLEREIVYVRVDSARAGEELRLEFDPPLEGARLRSLEVR